MDLKPLVTPLSKTFLSLIDTPSTYSGQSNRILNVKNTTDGLEFGEWTFNTSGHFVPISANTYSLGISGTEIKQLFLNNTGGISIQYPSSTTNGSATNYTFKTGGGTPYGGSYTFLFDDTVSFNGTGNSFILDLGATGVTEDSFFRITSNLLFQTRINLDVHIKGYFIGGEIGFSLNNVAGASQLAQALFFENITTGGISLPNILFRTVNTGQFIFNSNHNNSDFFINADQSSVTIFGTDSNSFNLYGSAYFGTQSTLNSSYVNIGLPASFQSQAVDMGILRISNSNSLTLSANRTTLTSVWLSEPNITLNGFTLTNATTLYIENAPTEATNNYALWIDSGVSRFDDNLNLQDAVNVILATTTGTKIGTATTQKLGFWNATPVVQYATTGTTTGYTANTSANILYNESTFTGNTGATAYTISDIIRALKLAGIIAS